MNNIVIEPLLFSSHQLPSRLAALIDGMAYTIKPVRYNRHYQRRKSTRKTFHGNYKRKNWFNGLLLNLITLVYCAMLNSLRTQHGMPAIPPSSQQLFNANANIALGTNSDAWALGGETSRAYWH